MKYLNVVCAIIGVAALLALRHLDLSSGVASVASTVVLIGVVGTVGVLFQRLLYLSNLRLVKKNDEIVVEMTTQVASAFWVFFAGLVVTSIDLATVSFLVGDYHSAVTIGVVLPLVAFGSYLGLIRTQITK